MFSVPKALRSLSQYHDAEYDLSHPQCQPSLYSSYATCRASFPSFPAHLISASYVRGVKNMVARRPQKVRSGANKGRPGQNDRVCTAGTKVDGNK